MTRILRQTLQNALEWSRPEECSPREVFNLHFGGLIIPILKVAQVVEIPIPFLTSAQDDVMKQMTSERASHLWNCLRSL